MTQRHSTRVFLPTPVPRPLLEDVVSLAQHSPSNSNIQPWRVKILSGTALRRLTSALVRTVSSGAPSSVEPLPEEYKHHRSALGRQLYGPEGYNIVRSDRDGSFKAQLRNYTFFDAPVGMVICMDRRLAVADALSVGIYLQTICLLLAERGVGSCIEVSVAGYPEVIRKELGLGEEMVVLTGLAVGYEDERHKVNKLGVIRDAWKESVEFVDE